MTTPDRRPEDRRPEERRLGLARLHVITPAGGPAVAVAAVEEALAAGAPLVQLRVKGMTDRRWWQLAADLVARCRDAGVAMVVNDRVDIAAAVGADGVHLGADDLPVGTARAILGPRSLIGATCRDVQSARQAEADGADYLGVGPAFASSTKVGLPEALGPAGVGRLAAAVGVPVVAIGGVDAERARTLMEAGAWGVAVCGAAFATSDPRGAIESLVTAVGGREVPQT